MYMMLLSCLPYILLHLKKTLQMQFAVFNKLGLYLTLPQ